MVGTTRYALTKINGGSDIPTPDDPADVAQINVALDQIDLALGILECTSTTRPASPATGQLIAESDTGNWYYRTIAGTWKTPNGIPNVGTSTQRTNFYGTPADQTSRVALHNRYIHWSNVDKGWVERYFADPADTSQLGPKLIAGIGANWFPVQGIMPICRISTSGVAGTSIQQGIGTGGPHSVTEIVDREGWYTNTAPNQSKLIPNIAGVYRLTSAVQFSAGSAERSVIHRFNGGAIQFGCSGTTSHLSASSLVSFNGTTDYVDTLIFVNAASISVVTQISLEYVGPSVA